MNRKQTIIVICLLLITIFIIIIFTISRAKSIELDDIVNIPLMTAVPNSKITYDEPINTFEVLPTATCTPIPIITPIIKPENGSNPSENAIGCITIATYKKTRTYDIMADVDERTLKRNIGHLPSSAHFGEIGLCILMAHRDTDFSILQYAKLGDKFVVTDINGKIYNYTVSSIEIIDSDSELRFSVTNESTLVLITCYPFRYTGHAPKKYLISCILSK